MLRKLILNAMLISLLATPLRNSAQKIAGGAWHSLFVCSDSTVKATGRNTWGQLGDSTTTNSNIPVQVIGLSSVVAVSAGVDFSIALKADGTVWAWGENYSGQLGDSTLVQRLTPVQVHNLTNVIRISAGAYHSLALKNDGTIWGWGYNSNGQIGDSTQVMRWVPVQTLLMNNVIEIGASESSSHALRNDSTVWSWGRNAKGQLGIGIFSTRSIIPVQTNIGSVRHISISEEQFCHAIKNNGTVWAWGHNDFGQLGNGNMNDQSTPVLINGVSNVNAMAGGYEHALALLNTSTIRAWGYNINGQVGNNSNVDTSIPVTTQNISGVAEVAAGGSHSLAVKYDGTVWAWGWNGNGQLGDGTNTDHWVPFQITTCSIMTGESEKENVESLAIYPNPASDFFVLNLKSGLTVEIKIYDSLGKEVYRVGVLESVPVDVHNLEDGIYFVTVNSGNKIFNAKFLKLSK